MVSDLHLGNGHSAFVRQGKETLIHRFLDRVAAEHGQLLILGDLLELWRFHVEAVLDYWLGLLDRLHQLHAVYIPGNHDSQVAQTDTRALHPLFKQVCGPLRIKVGSRDSNSCTAAPKSYP